MLLANNGGGEPGTFLGLYPPTSAGTIGYDLSKLVIAGVALWTIYRAIRPGTAKQGSHGPLP